MTKPFTDFERDATRIGVMWFDFITALGIWVYTNEIARVPTVAEAALAFNTTADLVREAARDHPWLYLDDDTDPTQQQITSDGE